MDFYTLRALAAEWHRQLAGAVVEAAWTQSPREATLSLGAAGAVRAVCEPGRPLVFRAAGAARQRRNTADVLAGVEGAVVRAVRTAERDRHVFLDLDDGRIQIVPFGPRPNVFWTDDHGSVRAAFLDDDEWSGRPAPEPRPAPAVDSPAAFASRWRPRRTLAQSVAGAVPLMTRDLAAEAVRRAGLDPDGPPEGASLDALFRAVRAYQADLETPRPHVYWRGALAGAVPGGVAEAFALVPLADVPDGWTAEPFATVDAALAVWARRRLSQRAYADAYVPLERALAAAAARRQRSAEAMLEELSEPSRADRYETWGHLLMAAGNAPAGRASVVLADIVGGAGEPAEIPLDPARTAVENAERYYDRARRARRARAAAEARWEAAQADADAAADLLARVRATAGLAELREVQDAEAGALAALLGQRAEAGPAEPFHRIALPGGFEALVGKHARGNAWLTTRVASPHDLWLHARGVPGSHVVVRRPGRQSSVPPAAVEAAARLAAWFSQARSQSVVPVTVTERKYVRPVKGGPPGLVRVEREDVVDVAPAPP